MGTRSHGDIMHVCEHSIHTHTLTCTHIHTPQVYTPHFILCRISLLKAVTLWCFIQSFLQLSGDKSIMCSFRQLNSKEKSMSGMMQYIMYRDYGVFSFSQKGIVSYILCAGDSIIFIVEFILSYLIPFLDCKHLLKHCFTSASQFFRNLHLISRKCCWCCSSSFLTKSSECFRREFCIPRSFWPCYFF